MAHGLGEAGASVAVVDIAADKARSTAAELKQKGIRSIAIQADVRSSKDCQRWADQRLTHTCTLHSCSPIAAVISVAHDFNSGHIPSVSMTDCRRCLSSNSPWQIRG